MRPSKIKAKLQRGEPVLVTALALADPNLFEMASLMGFDGIWMDLEHHPISVETAANLTRAARVGGSDVMARPAKGEFMRLGRLLEAGAHGIMYPRCDDAEEARELVAWSKFAPLGRRGLDSGNVDNPFCFTPLDRYVGEANDQTFLVVQIEDPAALDNVEEIAKVEGVDVIFFGPGDFSLLSGIPGRFDHPELDSAIRRIATASAAAGKAWGMPSPSPERTRELLGLGARFLAHGADVLMVRDGLAAIRKNFGPLGFTFESAY
ncbi:MAG: HpcH/HpaI aldolase/citrate lyase family protein [Isosphaeraceae bacterium]